LQGRYRLYKRLEAALVLPAGLANSLKPVDIDPRSNTSES